MVEEGAWVLKGLDVEGREGGCLKAWMWREKRGGGVEHDLEESVLICFRFQIIEIWLKLKLKAICSINI